jgi:hypothetical protein
MEPYVTDPGLRLEEVPDQPGLMVDMEEFDMYLTVIEGMIEEFERFDQEQSLGCGLPVPAGVW